MVIYYYFWCYLTLSFRGETTKEESYSYTKTKPLFFSFTPEHYRLASEYFALSCFVFLNHYLFMLFSSVHLRTSTLDFFLDTWFCWESEAVLVVVSHLRHIFPLVVMWCLESIRIRLEHRRNHTDRSLLYSPQFPCCSGAPRSQGPDSELQFYSSLHFLQQGQRQSDTHVYRCDQTEGGTISVGLVWLWGDRGLMQTRQH